MLLAKINPPFSPERKENSPPCPKTPIDTDESLDSSSNPKGETALFLARITNREECKEKLPPTFSIARTTCPAFDVTADPA